MAEDGSPPWPGFVDALSTVLMMMVFFTLLLVLVVGTLSYIVALKDAAPTETTGSEETSVVAKTQPCNMRGRFPRWSGCRRR